MSKVALIAKFTARPDRRAEVATILDSLFGPVAEEDGTELYVLHQDASDADALWFYELYRDHDALGAHSVAPALAEAFAALDGLLAADAEIIVLDPVRAKGIDL